MTEKVFSPIVTLSGASGVGKTTIVKRLLGLPEPRFTLIQSMTTRAPRESDLPGEYRYLSDELFSIWECEEKFLWVVRVHGIRVGTRKEDIDYALSLPNFLSLMILTPNVIPTLMRYVSGRAIPFYLFVTSEEILERRLRTRGEHEETIAMRLADCRRWHQDVSMSEVPFHFISNEGAIETAVQNILHIVSLYHL